nr:NAD-dependent epimerase/dehydratase family protein [Paenalcaligenes hominis]
MHIVITGAGSFIGTALTQHLIQSGGLGNQPITRLTRTDLHLPPLGNSASWIKNIEGDLCSTEIQQQLFDEPVDYVFHLAGITSKRAEEDIKLSLAVNVEATTALLEALRLHAYAPVFVFTSSIGVFGAPLPPLVNDHTPVQPTLSYGTHKRIVELLIADYSRLGHIDGRTVRLSGVIARPPQPFLLSLRLPVT